MAAGDVATAVIYCANALVFISVRCCRCWRCCISGSCRCFNAFIIAVKFACTFFLPLAIAKHPWARNELGTHSFAQACHDKLLQKINFFRFEQSYFALFFSLSYSVMIFVGCFGLIFGFRWNFWLHVAQMTILAFSLVDYADGGAVSECSMQHVCMYAQLKQTAILFIVWQFDLMCNCKWKIWNQC